MHKNMLVAILAHRDEEIEELCKELCEVRLHAPEWAKSRRARLEYMHACHVRWLELVSFS